MEWIITNWILLLIVVLCLGMHFFGRCRSHGKHSEEGSDLHKGDTDACASDGSTTNKGGGCCH